MAKPDYTLKIKARDGKYSTRVGAAWTNRAGGINIKLDPGIAIVGGEGIDVTLWPYEERGERNQGGGSSSGYSGGPSQFDEDASDLPF